MESALEHAISYDHFIFLSSDVYYSLLRVSKQMFTQMYLQIIATLPKITQIPPGGIKVSFSLLCDSNPSNLMFLPAVSNELEEEGREEDQRRGGKRRGGMRGAVRGRSGWKPNTICAAAWGGHLRMLQKAIAHGGDVNYTTDAQDTLLHLGAGGGDEGVVDLLLSQGLSVNAVNVHDHQPLHVAATYKNVAVISALCQAGADVNKRYEHIDDDELYSSRTLRTPLHYALQYPGTPKEQQRVYECVQELLSCGANPILEDCKYQTTFDYAAFNGPLSVVGLIIMKCPTVTKLFVPREPPFRPGPLNYATTSGQLAIVEELLTYTSLPISPHETPLGQSIRYNKFELFKLLVKYDILLHVNLSSLFVAIDTRLPLHEVWNYMQIMLENGADVNARDTAQSTPLHMAVHKASVELVRLLLDNGANVNLNGVTGRSCLDWAVSPILHVAIAHMILEKNITNIDQQDYNGNTMFIEKKHKELVEALVAKGASVAVKNREGVMPVDLAYDGGMEEYLQTAFTLLQSME